jgi:DNA-binding Lrp family transcriptional regulator
MQETVALDAFDLALLAALQDNGARTNQDLAEIVHLSASQCSRRRARLEEDGVIRRYRAELDAGRLGFGVTVFIFVSLAHHSRDNARNFRDLVTTLPLVQEAHALTGEADYLLKVMVGDLAALAELVNDVLLPHHSVERVRSNIVLQTLKDERKLPIG